MLVCLRELDGSEGLKPGFRLLMIAAPGLLGYLKNDACVTQAMRSVVCNEVAIAIPLHTTSSILGKSMI
jgi:hypothetical protein